MPILDPPRPSLKAIRQKAVKQGLSNVLGSSGAQAVIVNFHLDECDDDPAAFHDSLFSAFQSRATEILERSVVKELYLEIGERFEPQATFDFVASMNAAKEKFNLKKVQ